MTELLLEGIRVLDLSQYLPGPYAGQVLADLGADVIKVEPPAGDPMRRLGVIDFDGLAPGYKLINAGKTVIHLDLKTEDGPGDLRAVGELRRCSGGKLPSRHSGQARLYAIPAGGH